MGNISVIGRSEAIVEIKKSEFIAVCMHTETEDEAKALVAEVKKQHRDARHSCYAYVCDFGKSLRSSDDGEPSGTAGLPILDVIRKRGLVNVTVVVTRYFGGILLGAPGLVRAYTEAASDAVSNAIMGEYKEIAKYKACLDYSEFDRYKNFLSKFDTSISDTEYGADITLSFLSGDQDREKILIGSKELFSGKDKVTYLGGYFELVPVK